MVRITFVVLLIACGGKPTTPAQPPTAQPAVASGSAQPAKPAVQTTSTIAAVVDGIAISIADVDREIDPETKLRIDGTSDVKARDYFLGRERMKALDALIDRRLLLRAATRAKVEVTDAEVDAGVLSVRQANNLTEAELVDVLAKAGRTMAQYRQDVREQFLVQRYANTQGAPVQRVAQGLRAKSKITILIADPPAAAKPPDMLDASTLLASADIETLTGRTQRFAEAPLEVATPDFDSKHFKADGQPESHDLAYRVWRYPAATLDAKWAELMANLPGSKAAKEPGDAAFTTSENKLRGHAFLDRKRSMIVLLVCGSDLCRNSTDVLALAKLMSTRLGTVR